jgi:transcriptional regulator with XRE-family HTH domain
MPRRKQPDALALQIGRRIKALREEVGLTQEKLAFEIEGGSKGHMSSLEAGLVMPTVATLKAIADRLAVLAADIVNDPRESDRAKLIELTRSLPAGTIRRLVRELSGATGNKK